MIYRVKKTGNSLKVNWLLFVTGWPLFFFKHIITRVINYIFLYQDKPKILNMAELNIQTLKQIIEKLPEDYLVEFKDKEGFVTKLSDNIQVNISEKKLVFLSH